MSVFAMDGIDGIQSNMTNTMNTPIEEIERTMPLLVRRYELRSDSAGPGQYRGGNGIIRSFLMLGDSTTFTLLSERERHGPWGLKGGRPGKGMRAFVVRNGSGLRSRVRSKGTCILGRGDEIQIRTAGGGGYGPPRARDRTKLLLEPESGLLSFARARAHYKIPKNGAFHRVSNAIEARIGISFELPERDLESARCFAVTSLSSCCVRSFSFLFERRFFHWWAS